MQNMYPGIPFSPNTILTRAINDTDTAIYVADSSVFPDGPNLATIGTDESAETILYAQKGDGVLSGCLRGIEGTAKSWRGNDLIARNFTAYDYEALRSNLSGHLEAENPHSVTPEMIQAAPEQHTHLTPTFTAGHIPLIGTDGNFTDSGQALDDLGGIPAAVETALNLHKEDTSNPHKVTAEQIAAAPVTHTHAASDIIDVLPITLGGTGAATAAEALANLGAASSDHTHANMLIGAYGMSDLTAGSSSLASGKLYCVYE